LVVAGWRRYRPPGLLSTINYQLATVDHLSKTMHEWKTQGFKGIGACKINGKDIAWDEVVKAVDGMMLAPNGFSGSDG